MSSSAGNDDERLAVLRAEWQAASSDDGLEGDYARLIDEWRGVEWRGGGTTLMAALGRQHDEVALCRGLAWLLAPDGGHGLGLHPLQALLGDLDPQQPVEPGTDVTIRTEVARGDTRADIVVRAGGWTVIVEAKVLAGEGDRQADRLHEQWANEDPTLLFLTRTGRLPRTAKDSDGLWVARSWHAIAALLRRAADEAGLEASAGARDYIETIGEL